MSSRTPRHRTGRQGRSAAALLAPVAVAAILLPAPAAAASPAADVAWSVATGTGDAGPRPNFGYVLEPGDVVEDVLVVENQGTEPLGLAVYAADGFSDDLGQLDVLPTGEASTGIGSWVTLAADVVDLPPGESIEVPFTLAVPADAPAGDHVGAVVTSLTTESGTSGVALDRRLGVRLTALVGGDLTAGLRVDGMDVEARPSWVPFAPGEALVTLRLTNTGNTRLTGEQVIRSSGPLGLLDRVERSALPADVLPGASVTVPVLLEGVPMLGRLELATAVAPTAVAATAVTAAPVAATAGDVAVSWPSVAVVLLLSGLVTVLAVRSARRRRAARGPAGAVVGPPDGDGPTTPATTSLPAPSPSAPSPEGVPR